METEYDFSELFERSEGDYAGELLERIFGGIIPFIRGDTDALGAGNWLSTIFGLFNTAGLLAVMIVTSYTIYTVVLDTASDGRTFGQQTDTKYTIMRTLLGLIAFVPVSGGYSLGQAVLLFLTLQGSALGDVVWTKTADAALSGQPLLAAPQNQSTNNFLIQGQFAEAFDALVMGHLCAINANAINSVTNGNGDPDLASPMEVYNSPGTEERTSASWLSISGRDVATLNHVIRFEDGSAAYGGRANFCGGVENSATISRGSPASYSFADQVAAARTRARFQNYVDVINSLSNDARNLAMAIYNGQRDVQQMQDLSRSAIRQATNAYVTGAAGQLRFSTDEAQALHEKLLADATDKGWVFAPGWQRGISMAASWYGSPDGDLRIRPQRENNLVEYLEGQGLRTGFFADTATRAMLSKAADDFETWDMMGGWLGNLSEPGTDAEAESYQGLTTDDPVIDSLLNWLYRTMLDLFNPVASSEGNFGYVDPMVSITQQGKNLMIAGGGMAAVGAGSSAFNWVPGLGDVAEKVNGPITTAGISLAIFGFIVSTMVPLIPLVFYYSSVISWLLIVVESLFAVPLAVLTLFAPAREATLVGSWNRILLSIFGIFLRPFFTVVGLIFAMALMSIALQFLYDLFYGLLDFMTPGQSVFRMFSLVGFVAVYVIVTCVTVLMLAQLITELGDSAMNLIGVGISAIASRMDIGSAAQQAAGLSTGAVAQSVSLGGRAGAIRQGLRNRLIHVPRGK